MTEKITGKLIIVGGSEDKAHKREILTRVAEEVDRLKGSLLITTVATHLPNELLGDYLPVFKDLGVKTVESVDIRTRAQAYETEALDKFNQAAVIFFTGGNQLRIASQIGGSPFYERMHDLYMRGGVVVGTSAGAAVMPETMLTGGPNDKSGEISDVEMSPGLGLIQGVVIDSHFAQRGRMGRLLSAVAHNPRNLGIGIDEDTAVIVEEGHKVCVIGSGAVYLIDGTGITHSSFAEKNARGIISIFNTRVHVLGSGDCFSLEDRQPVAHSAP